MRLSLDGKCLEFFKNHTEARSLDHSGFIASTKRGPILKLFKNYLRLKISKF